MKSLPLVSIVILNHRRTNALMRSLEAARVQHYSKREIIVVDNGSQDGTRGFLAAYAPEVRVVELERNCGACAGRNAGISAARGDIIITLDHDIFFESPLELAKVVDTLHQRPDIQVLAFKVCEERSGQLLIRGWCHPRDWKEYSDLPFESDYFNEGACAARREVSQRTGGYYERLFFGAEGWDLALRIIDCGFQILYQPQIKVCHLTPAGIERDERNCYFYTRNYLWTAAKDYPLAAGIGFSAVKLSMMLYLAIRTGQVAAFLRGLKDGLLGFRQVVRDRAPVHRSTLRYVRNLERGRPSVAVRLARHREAVQL
jgi:GT2 family glycosyltransferase